MPAANRCLSGSHCSAIPGGGAPPGWPHIMSTKRESSGDTKGCAEDAGQHWSGASQLGTTRRRQRLGEDSRALKFNPTDVQIPLACGGGNPVSGHHVRTGTQRSETPEAKVPQVHQRRAPRRQCLGPLMA